MQTPRRALVVSIHDVSPLTREMVAQMLHDLTKVGVDRVPLLVIPNHHKMAPIREDAVFCEWLSTAAKRHEVVLHGYFHMRPGGVRGWWDTVVTEHYTAGEGEFYDLPEGEASSRLEKGKRDFAATTGLSPRGFIAPAWLLGAEAEAAVKKAGFDYTTRLRSFKDLVTTRETNSQSLVWSVRAGWRRVVSLWWNALLARRLWGAPLLRIGLHPPDWKHGRIRRQALGLIRAALAGRDAMTYEDWLAQPAFPAMNSAKSKADLHIHSRHSTRAADWVLRRLEFPASYSDPLQIYKRLRDVGGMHFVTITDHNTIAGCLEIAHLPGVIFGEEVTANFPDDECKVHVLVWGLTETQHREIQAHRDNVFDLQRYLAEESLAHAVAHPLHSPDEKLTPLHFQKLALTFRHFEGINGRYHSRLSDAARHALGSLTPASIEVFVARTGLDPTHEEPWRKVFVGGSDDHGGVYPARAFTETPWSPTSSDFLANIREGHCEAEGEGGTPLALAHGTYSTAYRYVKAKFSVRPNDPGAGLIEKAFSRFMEGKDPTEFSLAEKLGFLAQGIATGKIFEMAMAGNTSLWKELSAYFSRSEVKTALARETAGVAEPERRAFLMANLIAGQLGYRFVTQFIAQLSNARFIESIQTISPLVPIAAMLSPYIHAFRQPRREWLREMTRVLAGTAPAFLGNQKRAWFTDTLEDVNGVATTIRKMAAAGVAAGYDITVVTCRSGVSGARHPSQEFPAGWRI